MVRSSCLTPLATRRVAVVSARSNVSNRPAMIVDILRLRSRHVAVQWCRAAHRRPYDAPSNVAALASRSVALVAALVAGLSCGAAAASGASAMRGSLFASRLVFAALLERPVHVVAPRLGLALGVRLISLLFTFCRWQLLVRGVNGGCPPACHASMGLALGAPLYGGCSTRAVSNNGCDGGASVARWAGEAR